MTSNIRALGSSTIIQDVTPPGLRRSRFSFHINTPRRRRWLLVQLVSVPDNAWQENDAELYRSVRARAEQPSLARLLDNFSATYAFNRFV